MTAAPAGTITISCPTLDGGVLSVTATTDPGTGRFAPEAVRCFGAEATGNLGMLTADGTLFFTLTPGDVITDAQLADKGITICSQVQSLSLALV